MRAPRFSRAHIEPLHEGQGGSRGIGWRRHEPRLLLAPERRARKLLPPPRSPAPQRPAWHPGLATRASHARDEQHHDARDQHHRLHVHPPPQEAHRRWQRPATAPPAAERVPDSERLARCREQRPSRLPLVVAPVQRSLTPRAHLRRHSSRHHLVKLRQQREEPHPKLRFVHHGHLQDQQPGGEPLRAFSQVF